MINREEQLRDALIWSLSDDTGISSKTLVAIAFCLPPEWRGFGNYPRDPSDLGRCLRMLEKLPFVRDSAFEYLLMFGENAWKNLIGVWDELVSLYNEELPSGRAPRTWKRMQELTNEGA